MPSVLGKVEEKRRRGRPAKQIDRRVKSYKGVLAALPDTQRAKLTFDREVFAKSYALSKWLSAYGLVVLNTHEYLLLNFISARTVHFGKLAEMITKEHFLRGVWSEGELVCSPVGMWERELYKTIHSLEEKGFVVVQPLRVGSRKLPTMYEIAIDFIIQTRPSEAVLSKLRSPRKQKTAEIFDLEAFRAQKTTKVIGVMGHHAQADSLVSCDTMKYTKVNHEDNEVLVAAAPPSNEGGLRARRKPRPSTPNAIDCKASAREVIRVTLARVTEKRDMKVARAAQGSAVSLTDLNATWKKAMITAYGTCTVSGLTHKEFGMFKRITKAHELSCSWLEFFTWVIGNWSRINKETKEFGDYKKRKSGDWSLKEEDRVFLGTETPDLFMTVKNFGKLVKRFSQYSLGSVAAPEKEDSLEVKQLRAELEESRKQERTTRHLMMKSMAVTGAAKAPVKEKKSSPIVNPEGDDFFDNADADLPGWK